jgi:multidrug efflux pump subunit AcrB
MLIMIYAALAIPLKSYGQPLLIMAVIPFGLVGAILGHLLLGKDLSVISIIGIVAMCGVVVNDSLVLVDYINQRRQEGLEWASAVMEAGERRFRAVILTSVTTFVGLLPIQLETSIQAQFLKPMAISVAFGVLFATVMTLLLVPVLYFIAKDAQALGQRTFARLRGAAAG